MGPGFELPSYWTGHAKCARIPSWSHCSDGFLGRRRPLGRQIAGVAWAPRAQDAYALLMGLSRPQDKHSPTVSLTACETLGREVVAEALVSVLAPLGGMGRFVSPGMQVLLKPNLLTAAAPDQAVTTHPTLVEAVTKSVQEAGGTVLIGDSPAGPLKNAPRAWHKSGLREIAARTGSTMVPFEEVSWHSVNGTDYFIARPVLEADLVINLPKLKTHALTLYTGAIKNLFGAIPGTRKRELHFQAPGVQDFSSILVDVLELVQPGLTIMDGLLGQEGNGPGSGGTPHWYGCLAASTDPVALDTVMTEAMGYRPGEVLRGPSRSSGPRCCRPGGHIDSGRRAGPGIWRAAVAQASLVLLRPGLGGGSPAALDQAATQLSWRRLHRVRHLCGGLSRGRDHTGAATDLRSGSLHRMPLLRRGLS